ncbi:LPS biosynthesis glycosyltransferase [Malikia granosa]|nr:LPS biosynthesis glycosyltransferase [Malikia granosa]
MRHQTTAAQEKTDWLAAFDQVRIINLRSRSDRRTETIREFMRYGWTVPDSRVRFFDALAPQEAAGFPNAGVRGCFLSHLGVLREAWQAGCRSVLVLEDDIAFTRDMDRQALLAVRSLQTQDWDIAYFGHDYGNQPGEPSWIPIQEPRPLAHCYAVNGQTLPALVAFLEQVLQRPPGHPDGGPMHFDGALSTFVKRNAGVRAVHCSRNLVYQRPSRTNLHAVSVLDRHRWLAPVAKLYRAIKRLYWRQVR